MSLADDFHTFVAKLHVEVPHLADEARQLWARAFGDEHAFTTEVGADARHVAVTAGPVVAEIKADAASIGEDVAQETKAMAAEAVADVKAAAADIAKPSTQA